MLSAQTGSSGTMSMPDIAGWNFDIADDETVSDENIELDEHLQMFSSSYNDARNAMNTSIKWSAINEPAHVESTHTSSGHRNKTLTPKFFRLSINIKYRQKYLNQPNNKPDQTFGRRLCVNTKIISMFTASLAVFMEITFLTVTCLCNFTRYFPF